MGEVWVWIAAAVVLAVIVTAVVAVRRGAGSPADGSGSGGGGPFGGIDEVFAPTRHEAMVELEQQNERTAPAPVAGDPDWARIDGVFPDHDADNARSGDADTSPGGSNRQQRLPGVDACGTGCPEHAVEEEQS